MKVILFGGNGFVGTAIAEELVHQGVEPVCVSRTGEIPKHLKQVSWAEHVEWIKGDALNPDPSLFVDVQAVVALIGSPPIPTFSKMAYNKQLAMNSEPNLAVINAMANSTANRLVLMGAHLPNFMQTDNFAYAKGKRLCEEAAIEFSSKSEQHTAVVLKPTGIYGVRHTKNGKRINIASIMRPIAKFQSMMSGSVSKFLPETLVSVSEVSVAAVRACLNDEYYGKFTVMTNENIISQSK